MKPEFNGKTILVTGASRGIGASTALAFAEAGASNLILQYNSFRDGAERTAVAARQSGTCVDVVQADLCSDDGIGSLIEYLRTSAPAVDVLVNNAGSLVQRARLAAFTSDLYDRVMNLNFKSAWFLAQTVAPGMIERGSGFIVNLSSIAARNGGGLGAAIYAASKAAVSAMTKGLARELAPHGIRVNAVSPGTVDNDFHARFSTREMLDSVIAQTPAGRLGTNEEVAATILFLCSPAARFIYGQTIEINGGMYMV